jgi:hypothetical protein
MIDFASAALTSGIPFTLLNVESCMNLGCIQVSVNWVDAVTASEGCALLNVVRGQRLKSSVRPRSRAAETVASELPTFMSSPAAVLACVSRASCTS